jgi:hypothetical protein
MPGGVPGLCFYCQVKLVGGVKGVAFEKGWLLVFCSGWDDSPLGEGDDIKDDQIHEGDEHQDAQGAREACLTEDFPVRNDDDENDHESTQHEGEEMLVRHGDVGFGRLVVL